MHIRRPVASIAACLALALGVAAADAAAISITATASWAGLPVPVVPSDASQIQDPLVNGDFTIQNGAGVIAIGDRGFVIGDGINEQTDWSFDFTGDPDFAAWDFDAPIVSALLELRLIPRGLPAPSNPGHPNAQLDDFCSDGVFFHGISGGVRLLSPGEPCSVFAFDVPATAVLDMLTYSSGGVPVANISQRIQERVRSGAGLLATRYIADAIIERAELTLVAREVPEAPSALLAFAGLGLLLAARRRRARGERR